MPETTMPMLGERVLSNSMNYTIKCKSDLAGFILVNAVGKPEYIASPKVTPVLFAGVALMLHPIFRGPEIGFNGGKRLSCPITGLAASRHEESANPQKIVEQFLARVKDARQSVFDYMTKARVSQTQIEGFTLLTPNHAEWAALERTLPVVGQLQLL